MRRAFALAEFIVVVAIVAVLVTLLVPAVQHAREAARRARCQQNMHRIALALLTYHDARSTFPSATGKEFARAKAFHDWSWLSMVLPFLNQGALYNAANFDQTVYGGKGAGLTPANSTVARTVVAQFYCPDDPASTWIDSYGGASSSYLSCGGGCGSTGRCDTGVFFVASRVRLCDITDGTSHTILFGEGLHRKCRHAYSGYFQRVVGRWTGVPLNSYPATQALTCPTDFSSRHPGGAWAAFADGTVRFLSEKIAQKTLTALGTRAGNEQVDDSAF